MWHTDGYMRLQFKNLTTKAQEDFQGGIDGVLQKLAHPLADLFSVIFIIIIFCASLIWL